MVVCRQLNAPTVGALFFPEARYGMGPGEILLDDVRCEGTEQRLIDCPRRIGHNCGHSEDVSVRCRPPVLPPSPGDLRLNGSSNDGQEGRLEIFVNNAWGTVCDNLFGSEEAMVACSQLGFSTSISDARVLPHQFGGGTGQIWLENVTCAGSEARLNDCSHPPLGEHNCTHSEDVRISCTPEVPIRLIGGASNNTGRVEIFINNEWGTVCNDLWDNQDATVVCRQLGFPTDDAVAITSGFTRGAIGQRIWLDDIQCIGVESSLYNCQNGGDGVHNCNHAEDAGVRCQPGCSQDEVRLQGGTNSSGRVEICNNNVWGTVCESMWDNSDARVVCRQLGLRIEGAIALTSGFTNGLGQIWLTDVQCVGTESRLADCTASMQASCFHSDDAGVDCPPMPPPSNLCTISGALRLVNGSSNREGRVEVCSNNAWGTVCDDLWDDVDAAVACAQLGFSRIGAMAFERAFFGQGTGAIVLDNVQCIGNEGRLTQCANAPSDCQHFEDAGLRCGGSGGTALCENFEVRLVGGASSLEGRVEICNRGVFGTVCDDFWDNRDATVVCRQLGYTNLTGVALFDGFTNGAGQIWLDDVECSGRESTLISCRHSPFETHNGCLHFEDAGVRCMEVCVHGALRLVGGVSSLEGRVEICNEGVFGTVCDDLWDYDDAGVVCRQLGYASINAVPLTSGFTNGEGQIWLDDVECAGTESQLINCPANQLGNHDCAHSEDAGVRCFEASCVHGALRLEGGASNLEGRVEICNGGVFGTVCDDFWDDIDASVVCRQLGHAPIGAVALTSGFTNGIGEIWLDDVRCAGTESQLINCPANPIGVHNCRHSEDAGVRCLQGLTLPAPTTPMETTQASTPPVETTTPSVETTQATTPFVGTTQATTPSVETTATSPEDTQGTTISTPTTEAPPDVNECEVLSGGCHQICTNTDGSFMCSCEMGFRLLPDRLNCEDVDECLMAVLAGSLACDDDSMLCTNTPGSFLCTCPDGTELRGGICREIVMVMTTMTPELTIPTLGLTTPSQPPITLPPTVRENAVGVTLSGITVEMFGDRRQEEFRRVTAEGINRIQTLSVGADNVVLTNIRSNGRNAIDFDLFVQSGNNVLNQQALLQSVQNNAEAYNSAGFIAPSVRALVPSTQATPTTEVTSTTDPTLIAGGLTIGAVAGIIVVALVVVLVIMAVIVLVIYFYFNRSRKNKHIHTSGPRPSKQLHGNDYVEANVFAEEMEDQVSITKKNTAF